MSAEAELVQPRTSFLNLPNDILLPILEEFYEQRYESITPATPLRIAEILINKRIFFLARPLWHKRLTISEAQLDSKLSGLLEDRLRQGSVSELDLALTNTFANLTRTVISLLPRLTELTIAFNDEVQEPTSDAIADRIACIHSLRRLSLSSWDNLALLTRFTSRYNARNTSCRADRSLTRGGELVHATGRKHGLSLYSYKYGRNVLFGWSEDRWSHTHSMNLLGTEGLAIPAEVLIRTLQHAMSEATSNNDLVSTFPLYKFAMDLEICPEDQATDGLFTLSTFHTFFGLLESSDLRQLELRELTTLPKMADGYKMLSLELLRLSGTVHLRVTLELPPLLALLTSFPSLRQLHLIGTFFAADSDPADSMSKHETMPLYFHYPQLCTLLTYLRQSSTSSNSSNKSIEKSAGDMGTAENATGGCHASSIPQLPEEIILHIFEYLRLDLYDDRSFFDQAPGASNCIVLNKRFYAFLRPSWFSSLLASTAASNLLAVALRRPQDYNCITAINLVFYLETPSYTEFADLCRLPNLRKISVALEKRSADTSNFDGSKLLKPLEKLKDLTHLEITSQFGIRFTSCTWERGVTSNSFIKIAPRLTSLHLSFPQMTDLYLALRKSPGTLRRLALTFQSCRDWWAIPWATLEDLTFSGSSMGMKQELCKAFKDALYPARVPHYELFVPQSIALRRLHLDFDIHSTSEECFDLSDLRDLFDFLVQTSIQTLELKFHYVHGDVGGTGKWNWGTPIVLPSLENLTLSSLRSLRNEEFFDVIWQIICSFPSLLRLNLQTFHLSNTHSARYYMLAALPQGKIGLMYPELGAILCYAEKESKILEVTYQDQCYEHEVRWHRSHSGDEFQKDVYSLCWELD